MGPLITLLTDFGTRDPYVAAMKGVISSICPSATILDLTHEIPPQDVLEAAWFLASAAHYFPQGTIHVAVVDPGVGTERLPVAVSSGNHRFVCPNSGLLTLVVRDREAAEARVITNKKFLLEPVSATFHGRDVFAPAAARLANGAPFSELGPPLKELARLCVPEPVIEPDGGVQGEVIHVDRFGNAITNIHRSMLAGKTVQEVFAGKHSLGGLKKTYAAAGAGEPLVLFGSAGYLEIAVNQGNAAARVGLKKADRVEIRVLCLGQI